MNKNPWPTHIPDELSWIQDLKTELGFSHFGFCPLEKPLSFDFYRQWIETEKYGSMEYLKTHLPLKENPRQTFSTVESVLVFAFPYRPHPEPLENPLSSLSIARYAQGIDYHYWLKKRLKTLVEKLQFQNPESEFLVFTDSAPLMERDLGYRSGLGWFGKNTCLIHPQHGSFFLIGEILTSWKPSMSAPIVSETHSNPFLPDLCGKCNRCIDACPTGALTTPKQLDATKCISYWTIESKQTPPLDLRKNIGSHFFGCDICQDVCPWNQKIYAEKSPASPDSVGSSEDEQKNLHWLLSSSHQQIQKKLFGSPLLRAGPKGLKRNALIVIGNKKIQALKPLVERCLQTPELKEVAQWCLDELSKP